jgi:sporulation related protein/PilZ domain-containing protein
VDKLRRAFLSDLSEGGVAFDGLVAKSGPNVVSLAFNLPEGGGTIEALGEVVWTCDSRHRTGVRFLEMVEASRRRLRDWLSARVVTLDSKQDGSAPWNALSGTGAARNWILQEIGDGSSPEHISDGTSEAPQSSEAVEGTSRNTTYRVIGMVLGLVVVCSAFVTLGYYLPAWLPGPKASGYISTSDSPVQSSSDGSITSVSQTSRNTPAKYGGFVLQVGAMSHKDNADALAESLRQKNFPAFVFERGRDGLYRVDVGPYQDSRYAHGVKAELASAGFKSVLERHLSH